MKTRRRARRVTLETLYEYDIANHDPDEVLEQRLEENPMERAGVEFAERLIHGVIAYQEKMDTLIARYAPEWPLDRRAQRRPAVRRARREGARSRAALLGYRWHRRDSTWCARHPSIACGSRGL